MNKLLRRRRNDHWPEWLCKQNENCKNRIFSFQCPWRSSIQIMCLNNNPEKCKSTLMQEMSSLIIIIPYDYAFITNYLPRSPLSTLLLQDQINIYIGIVCGFTTGIVIVRDPRAISWRGAYHVFRLVNAY